MSGLVKGELSCYADTDLVKVKIVPDKRDLRAALMLRKVKAYGGRHYNNCITDVILITCVS